jgi:hypothetical protein
MMKTSTKFVAALALALGAASIHAQGEWTYIDVQDGVNYPGAGNTYDANTDATETWGSGVDGNSAYGWRYRFNSGPGVPAFGSSAYSGFGATNQANFEADPSLYVPLSGLLPDTDYFVRVYAIYPRSATNAVVTSRPRLGAEFSLDGEATWEFVDSRGSSVLNWVDNSSGVGAPMTDPLNGDSRAWTLLGAVLRTDGLGNGQIDLRLPMQLPDGSDQDRFHIDGFAIAVPEPSTFALIGLGSAALMIFRRRR